MACTATPTTALLSSSSPNPITRPSSYISPKSSLSTKTLSIFPTSFNGLRKPFLSRPISSPRSLSRRTFLVRAGELPLVGNKAPDFEAEAVFDQEFIKVKLSEYIGKKYVILFFYPLDFTFVCPTEITAFSDRHAEFEKLNTEILGVSIDSVGRRSQMRGKKKKKRKEDEEQRRRRTAQKRREKKKRGTGAYLGCRSSASGDRLQLAIVVLGFPIGSSISSTLQSVRVFVVCGLLPFQVLSNNARFEQIWRTRKGEKDAMRDDGALHEMCLVYDVVRVDVVDTTIEANEQEDTDFEDHRIMSSYLPLLREFIPSAAAEIESDIHDYVSKQASKDDYVYDLYTVKDDVNTSEEDASNPFPLVHVDDDNEFYDGPITSDNESDDSNAEDNPLNDYPDKETSEDDDEHGGSRTSKSNDESEEPDSASASSKSEDLEHQNWSEDVDPFDEGYICGHDGGDGDYYDDDGGGDNDEWKWSYR